MAMHGVEFQYPTLKSGEIRLLSPKLRDSGVLTWELKSAPLLSNKGKIVAASDYEALSYTWGKPEDQTFPVTCNDQTLMVRKNLHDALPYLARRLKQAGSPERRIWIDAVCINQSNDTEKFEQINLMPKIYRLARQVVVWLGPGRGNGHSVAAFALIPLLAQTGKEALKYLLDTRQPRPNFLKTAMPDASSPVWNVLGDILFHDWYTRVWVVQEIALAQSAVALIGDNTLEFNILDDLLGFFMGIIGNQSLDFGPGITVLQKEAVKRKIDVQRIAHNWRVAGCRGWLNEARDMEPETPNMAPEQALLLQESSGPTAAPRKGWRRHIVGFINRYQTWKAVSSQRRLAEISNLSAPTPSTATPVPSAPQIPVSQDKDSLLNAVFLTAMLQQCERAHDHVFGVLGFAETRDEIRALHLEDRHDLADLYTVFMGYIFEGGGRVRQDPIRRYLWELFNYGCLPNKNPGLPSWCPDLQLRCGPSTPIGFLSLLGKKGFTTENEKNPLGFVSDDYIYSAGTGMVDIRRGGSQNVLVMKGTVFSYVREVFPAFPQFNLTWSKNKIKVLNTHVTIGEWEKEVAAKALGPAAGDEGAVSWDTYWRTLVGDQMASSAGDSEFTHETLLAVRDFQIRAKKSKTKFEELEQRYGSYDAIFSEGRYTITEDDKEFDTLLHSPAMAFSINIGEVQFGRQLFTTTDGRFGFGNVGLQEGDVVCIFNGAVTPHILRKVSGNDGTYTLVAAAYIHGLMNGEIEELGLEREEIRLV